jgi:integrase
MFAEKQGKDSSFIKFQITEFFNRPDFRPVKGDVGISYDDCLTAKELTDLKLTASRKTALMIDALYQTAARVSELLAVRLSDCTPGTNGIKVFITNGKGGKSRTVYLTTALYNDIVKTFKGKIYLLETKNKTPFLRTNVFHQIKSAGENIGIYNLHPHTLRHTWATLNLEKLGIYKTSNYLGHTDISTTAKYYLHNKPTESDILNLFNGVEK